MFKRYGSWLLLFCALLLLGFIALRQPMQRAIPSEIQRNFRAGHYIIADQVYLDINAATIEEFMELPDIGEKTAQRIVDYRDAHGSFASIDDLCNVDGIGEGIFRKIAPYIAVVP